MAESPHKLVFDWGTLWRYSRGEWQRSPEGAAVSYDGLGNQFLWYPSNTGSHLHALDVECFLTDPPEALQPTDMTKTEFLNAWTFAEVLAKLSNVPILTWLQGNPLRVTKLQSHFIVSLPSGATARCHCFIWPEVDAVVACGYVN